jgi:hypothetical protein
MLLDAELALALLDEKEAWKGPKPKEAELLDDWAALWEAPKPPPPNPPPVLPEAA